MLNKITNNLFLLILVLAISSVVSFRSYDGTNERNDTSVYFQAFKCQATTQEYISCDKKLGNTGDFIYSVTSYLFAIILNGNFDIFLLIISMFINYYILKFVFVYSPMPLVSLLFLLSHYRFWDFSANALRAGIALTILLYIFSNPKIVDRYLKYNILYRLLPIAAHFSLIPTLLINQSNIKRIYLLLIVATVLFISQYFFEIMALFESFGILPSKLEYYIHIAKKALVAEKVSYISLLIFIMGIVMKNAIYGKRLLIWNSFILFFIVSLIMSPLGLGYRYFSFSLPFISILLSIYVTYILGFFHENLRFLIICIIHIGFTCWAIFMGIHNYDLFLIQIG